MTVRKSFQSAFFAALILGVLSLTLGGAAPSVGQTGPSVYPPIPTGQTVVTGALSSGTGSTVGPGSIVMVTPAAGATRGVRNYVYQAACINSSSGATVAAIWDSSTTGATPGVQLLWYVPCPASAASGGQVNFNPPLTGRPGSAIGMSTITSVSTAYLTASGFTAR